ncbi:MAG: peptidyl-prolyl cis-trans isomerase [Deltaproteobacteria bacterium]|nr:peptidyl-prolyl cis-trans isomerase [Deltaproteobacteria bacterium]
MSKTRFIQVLIPLLLSAACVLAGLTTLPGCQNKPAASSPAPRANPDDPVLAVVNGREITRSQLLSSMGNNPESEFSEQEKQDALEQLVEHELILQKGIELGLDSDQGYDRIIRKMENRLLEVKRKQMYQLFYKKEFLEKAQISDESLKEYFEQNQEHIQSDYYLQGLSFDEENKARKALERLAGGESFEKLALELYPNHRTAKHGKPWDMGKISLLQLPDKWRQEVMKLNIGQNTGLIYFGKSGYRILRLADKKPNPALTFEAVRKQLFIDRRSQLLEEQFREYKKELRNKATISMQNTP